MSMQQTVTSPQQAQSPPHANYDTRRSLLKYLLLGLITFGIYSIWLTARSGEDLNSIAGHRDNRRSMNYWLIALLFSWLTLGIAPLVWWHKTSDRIGNELMRRGLRRRVSAADFWLWCILGSLIIVGPFIFIHKWLSGMNDLCADFNRRG